METTTTFQLNELLTELFKLVPENILTAATQDYFESKLQEIILDSEKTTGEFNHV